MPATSNRLSRVGLPVLVLLVIAALDYATGSELGFFVFYFVPVALAAWSLGRWPALGMAVAAAGCWFVIDTHSGHSYGWWFARYWDTAIRFTSFVLVAVTTSRIENLLTDERRLNRELSEAFASIKQLRGLIPICGSCKSVRNDKGYWEQLEGYIENHSEALFSHGLCPECLERLTGELDRVRPAPSSPQPPSRDGDPAELRSPRAS